MINSVVGTKLGSEQLCKRCVRISASLSWPFSLCFWMCGSQWKDIVCTLQYFPQPAPALQRELASLFLFPCGKTTELGLYGWQGDTVFLLLSIILENPFVIQRTLWINVHPAHPSPHIVGVHKCSQAESRVLPFSCRSKLHSLIQPQQPHFCLENYGPLPVLSLRCPRILLFILPRWIKYLSNTYKG